MPDIKGSCALALVISSFLTGGSVAAKTTPAHVGQSRYATAVEQIKTCDDLAARITSAPLANSLLLNFAKRDTSRKDEFESTYDFHNRLGQELTQLLGPSRRVVVTEPVKDDNVSYDADTQRVSLIWLFLGSVSGSPKKHQAHLDIGASLDNAREYTASNAFGSRVQVTSGSLIEAYVAFDSEAIRPEPTKESGPFSMLGPTDTWSFTMPPEEARMLKSGQLLYSGILVEPFFHSSGMWLTPTLDSPSEGSVKSIEYFTKPECLFLIAGGRIVHRFIG